MAILKINPTRMNLLALKKQIKVAKRGWKLLKDKRDGLMQKFMAIIRETKSLREKVEAEMGEIFSLFFTSSVKMDEAAVENALFLATAKLNLNVKTENIMSVRVPKFEFEFSGNAKTFAPFFVVADFEAAIEKLQKIFPILIQLAQIEKTAENLATEAEKTRRRVNALEHKRIPDLVETQRFITMKLEEQARDALVNVMRIKKIIEAKDAAAVAVWFQS